MSIKGTKEINYKENVNFLIFAIFECIYVSLILFNINIIKIFKVIVELGILNSLRDLFGLFISFTCFILMNLLFISGKK